MSAGIPRDEPLRPWSDKHGGDFSVLSWNLLADIYHQGQVAKKNRSSTHVSKNDADWLGSRWPLVRDEIATTQPDIVCFQEVQVEMFHRDIWPCLQDVGYDGVLLTGSHEAKWAEKGDPPGDRVTVATFWLRDAFSLDDEVHRHRTLGLVLRCLRQGKDSQVEAVGVASVSTTTSTDTSGCDGDVEAPYDGAALRNKATSLSLAVANVHLEGGGDFAVHRLKQLHRVLSALAVAAPHHGLVVTGDFNCILGASAASSYLAFGSVEPGVPEWGRPCPPEVARVPTHGYTTAAAGGMQSAHECSSAANVTGTWSFGEEFTYCAAPGHPVDGLDQMWFTAAPLRVVARRALFRNEAHRTGILAGGLPSALEPSDHLPIGAVFAWTRYDDLPDLVAAAAKEAAAAAARTSTAIGPSTTREDVETEIAALLATCPFESDADRAEYANLLVDPPGLSSGRKPTPDQLAMLKARRERKAVLVDMMPPDAQQVLKRVNALSKAMKKLPSDASESGSSASAPMMSAHAGGTAVGDSTVIAAASMQDVSRNDKTTVATDAVLTEEEELALALKLSMTPDES